MNMRERQAQALRDLELPSDTSTHNDRLNATYEHAGVGLVEGDRDGRMVRVNRQLYQLTGRSGLELLGRTIFEETVPEDVDLDMRQFKRQVAGEIDRYTVEKRIVQSNGGYFWADITSTSVCDAAGKFLFAVRVQHDISARKRVEQMLGRRTEQQAALFQFSEKLQHAASLHAVYEAALDGIVRALACQRAAILLFDPSGVMRFVAWRGLSDGYRQAVEGHSPWPRDERRPQPVCLE